MFDVIMRITFGVILSAVATLIAKKMRDWHTLGKIPGPKGWRIAGNYHKVKGQPLHLKAMNMKDTCKDLMRIRRYDKTLIVLNSFNAIEITMKKAGSSVVGRPTTQTDKLLSCGYKGICSRSHMPIVEHLRKLIDGSMQLYNIGIGQLEVTLESVVDEMIQEFKKKKKRAFDPWDDIFATVSQLMFILHLGQKITRDDPLINRLKSADCQVLLNMHDAITPDSLVDTFPWMNDYFGCTFHVADSLKKKIEERNDLISYMKQRTKNYTDDLMGQQNILSNLQRSANVGVEGYTFDENDSWNVVLDMLIAGTFPITASIYSLLHILAKHPQIQEKMYEELNRVVGKNRLRLMDESSLPFCSAVILELGRHSPALPLGMRYRTVQEEVIMDNFFPKHTSVICNLFGVLHDEAFWSKPYEFHPERFLTEEGKIIPVDHPNRQRLLVYGTGPRACVGQTLVRTRLFLVAAMLIRNFRFRHPENDVKVSCDPREYEGDRVLKCPKYKIIAAHR